jgi:hypothetical protein
VYWKIHLSPNAWIRRLSAGMSREETVLAGTQRNDSHSGIIQKTVEFRVSCLAPGHTIHPNEITWKFVLGAQYQSNRVTKIHFPYQINVFDPSLLCPFATGTSDK